jgi:hypothetical protein
MESHELPQSQPQQAPLSNLITPVKSSLKKPATPAPQSDGKAPHHQHPHGQTVNATELMNRTNSTSTTLPSTVTAEGLLLSSQQHSHQNIPNKMMSAIEFLTPQQQRAARYSDALGGQSSMLKARASHRFSSPSFFRKNNSNSGSATNQQPPPPSGDIQL